MSQDISLPEIEGDAQEITLVTWLKQPGNPVRAGEVIAEVLTEKANVEIESPYDGVLETLLVEEGETVTVGQVIARITR